MSFFLLKKKYNKNYKEECQAGDSSNKLKI